MDPVLAATGGPALPQSRPAQPKMSHNSSTQTHQGPRPAREYSICKSMHVRVPVVKVNYYSSYRYAAVLVVGGKFCTAMYLVHSRHSIHVTFEKWKQIRGSRVRFRRSGVGGAVGCLWRLDEIQARVPRRRLRPVPGSRRHFRPVFTIILEERILPWQKLALPAVAATFHPPGLRPQGGHHARRVRPTRASPAGGRSTLPRPVDLGARIVASSSAGRERTCGNQRTWQGTPHWKSPRRK